MDWSILVFTPAVNVASSGPSKTGMQVVSLISNPLRIFFSFFFSFLTHPALGLFIQLAQEDASLQKEAQGSQPSSCPTSADRSLYIGAFFFGPEPPLRE